MSEREIHIPKSDSGLNTLAKEEILMAKTYKYRLLSQYGNRVEYTDSEVEKNILLGRGFHIDENWQKLGDKKTTAPRKRKAVKNDNEGHSED